MPHFPLAHRISIVVFLCIIAVEAVVLVFSYGREEARMLTKLDQSIERVLPVLASPASMSASRALLKNTRLAKKYPIVGLMFERGYGRVEHIGNTENLGNLVAAGASQLLRLDDGSVYYDRLHHFQPINSNLTLKAWVRIDARALSKDLSDYVWGLVLIVLVLSVFVTAATIMALHPLLLRPLSQLRNLMETTSKEGLDHVQVPATALHRADELGDLARSFEQMRQDLSRAESSQRALAARVKGFAELGADCFWEVDRHYRFTFLAGNVEAMFGCPAKDLMGRSFMAMAQSGELPLLQPAYCIMNLRSEGAWQGDLNPEAGEPHPRSVRVVASLLKSEAGTTIGIRGTITDTTVASTLKRTIAHQETHDRITGLTNRGEFERQLNRKLAVLPSMRKPACVLALNLDRFKTINDACGHAGGDQLLHEIAALITEIVREDDLLARRDADSFSLLLEQCPLDNGLVVAEKLRAAIARHKFMWKGEAFALSASIGIAPIDRTVGRKENVMLNADAACYKAKESGRNQICAYDADDQVQLRRHDDVQWVTQINQAINEDRLLLFYQPIAPLSFNTPDYVHVEILVRMRSRDGQILPPGAFLPAAERYDQIDAIDRWIVGSVLKWLEEQQAPADMPLAMCVNLSGTSAADPAFQKFLTEAIKKANVNPAHLCFEMTESSAIHNLADTAVFLEQLRSLGCLIALDDFGTGFSSLEYIKQLPLDYIKIDGAFIRDITENQLDQALVRCVSEVARLLNVKTVAEFVENEATIHVLNDLSIDLAQGYYIARPKPLPSLDELRTIMALKIKNQRSVIAQHSLTS